MLLRCAVTAPQDPVAAFWQAWPSLREALNEALERRDFGDLPQRIGALTEAIHPRLEWELGPGQRATHAFALSAAGDMSLRHLTERWVRDAPTDDPVWEFHPARQPRPGFGLRLGDVELAADAMEAAFEVDPGTERVHVRVFHPAFAELDERGRGTGTFLMLDGLLGEDGVERWIGAVQPATSRPEGAQPFAELAAAVQALEAEATGERWALLEGQPDGVRTIVAVNRALKRVDHPLHTHRCELRVALEAPTAEGLPGADEDEVLGELEDRLRRDLGEHAAYLGRLTDGGARTFVLYAPPHGPAAAAVAAFCDGLERASATWEADPRWEFAAQFR